jgi:hypothetical protein
LESIHLSTNDLHHAVLVTYLSASNVSCFRENVNMKLVVVIVVVVVLVAVVAFI